MNPTSSVAPPPLAVFVHNIMLGDSGWNAYKLGLLRTWRRYRSLIITETAVTQPSFMWAV